MNTILLVDDDELTSTMTKIKLVNGGFNVITCCDGIEAKEQLNTSVIDLVVTDLNMPNFSGDQLVKYIRIDLNLTTPIVVVSSASDQNAKTQAFLSGADTFISKPFSPEKLISKINKLLNLV